jgi:drug/metabolite transporter superfamily protein YnfA
VRARSVITFILLAACTVIGGYLVNLASSGHNVTTVVILLTISIVLAVLQLVYQEGYSKAFRNRMIRVGVSS